MLTKIYIQDFIKWLVTSPFVYSCLAIISICTFGQIFFFIYKAVYNDKSYVTSKGLSLLTYVLVLSILAFYLDYLMQFMMVLNPMFLFERIDPNLLNNLMLPVHIINILSYQLSLIVIFICLFKTKKTLD